MAALAISNVLAIGAGGFVGAVARHFFAAFVTRIMGAQFPFGILATNVLGGFLMGAFAAYLAHRNPGIPELRNFLAVGVLGGFTTFSAFSLEVVLLYERGALGLAALYALLSVILSVGALIAGMALIRAMA